MDDKYVSENTSVLVDPLEIKVKMDYLANKKSYPDKRVGNTNQSGQCNYIY